MHESEQKLKPIIFMYIRIKTNYAYIYFICILFELLNLINWIYVYIARTCFSFIIFSCIHLFMQIKKKKGYITTKIEIVL
jgi:hypothetical protein